MAEVISFKHNNMKNCSYVLVTSINETTLGSHVYQKGPPNRGGVGHAGVDGSYRGGVGHTGVGG